MLRSWSAVLDAEPRGVPPPQCGGGIGKAYRRSSGGSGPGASWSPPPAGLDIVV